AHGTLSTLPAGEGRGDGRARVPDPVDRAALLLDPDRDDAASADLIRHDGSRRRAVAGVELLLLDDVRRLQDPRNDGDAGSRHPGKEGRVFLSERILPRPPQPVGMVIDLRVGRVGGKKRVEIPPVEGGDLRVDDTLGSADVRGFRDAAGRRRRRGPLALLRERGGRGGAPGRFPPFRRPGPEARAPEPASAWPGVDPVPPADPRRATSAWESASGSRRRSRWAASACPNTPRRP